ncbi:MAG: protein kinase [Planctomycetes bacterium]|nr:protein kinase [Planctomycetota bacterium]
MGERSAEPKTGDVLGEYVLLARIGEGGFGEVWKARHFHWKDRFAAVKIPRSADHLRDLRNEGMIGYDLSKLDSPHIARTLGLNLLSDPPYFLMEYVEGASLRAILDRRRRLPPAEALEIVDQVLSALVVAHGAGIVHRDIKPGNVLVATGGLVKLTDFGIGIATQSMASSILFTGSFRTSAADGVAGTYEYMSPEQKRGRDVDAASDLFAVGVVFFEMLTGELPEPGDKPSDLVSSLPEAIDDFFAHAYVRKERRFHAAAEMQAEARRLKALIGVPGAPRGPAGRDPQTGAAATTSTPRESRPGRGGSTGADLPRGVFPGPRAEARAESAATAKDPHRGRKIDLRHVAGLPGEAINRVVSSPEALARAAFTYGDPPPGGAAPRPGRDRKTPELAAQPLREAIPPTPAQYDALVEFVRRNPDNYRALTRLGIAEFQRGNLARAYEHLARVCEIRPGSATAFNNLGIVCARQSRLQEAVKHYQRAIELSPNHAEAHNNLGTALFHLGREEDARVEHGIALKLDPRSTSALYNLMVPT